MKTDCQKERKKLKKKKKNEKERQRHKVRLENIERGKKWTSGKLKIVTKKNLYNEGNYRKIKECVILKTKIRIEKNTQSDWNIAR